ncbi:MAG: helix-turn-helix domain-containing protein [Bacteroidetes bacterium]|nr:helix-turn-helix domain-containing protein [Bacteroidota bacterium]
MAKKKGERLAAFEMFCNGKLQKEIAAAVGVTEKTISDWAKDENWKAERDARLNSAQKRAEDIKEVISHLTERRLAIFREIKEAEEKKDQQTVLWLKKEAVAVGQETAMHTKALLAIDKEQRINLGIYIEIMEDIFKHLQNYDANLYLKTLDFQEYHLSTITEKLG